MEAICSSETSGATQRATRRHISEDDTLRRLGIFDKVCFIEIFGEYIEGFSYMTLPCPHTSVRSFPELVLSSTHSEHVRSGINWRFCILDAHVITPPNTNCNFIKFSYVLVQMYLSPILYMILRLGIFHEPFFLNFRSEFQWRFMVRSPWQKNVNAWYAPDACFGHKSYTDLGSRYHTVST
jgi:hypothetical protein